MGLVTLVNPIIYPATQPMTNFSSINSYLINATGEKVSSSFYSPVSGTISGAGFNLATVTTGGTLTVNLKNVDTATGFPGGTTHATGTVVISDTDDNTHKDVTFSSSYSASAGELLSLEIVCGSPGDMNLVGLTSIVSTHIGIPRLAHDSGAGYAFQAGRTLAAVINYSGTYRYHPSLAHYSGSSVMALFEASTLNKRHGVKFRLPFAATIAGLRAFISRNTDAEFILWGSDGATKLRTVSIDKDSDLQGTSVTTVELFFSSPYNLSANTWYRLTIGNTTGNNTGVYRTNVSSSAKLGALPGGVDYFATESNTNPPTQESHWTDTATATPTMQLLLSGIHDGAGGGIIGVQGLTGIGTF